MEYKEILDIIYDGLALRQDAGICGGAGMKALQELEDILDADQFYDTEKQFSEALSESARNGFYQGFRCAAALLAGGSLLPGDIIRRTP